MGFGGLTIFEKGILRANSKYKYSSILNSGFRICRSIPKKIVVVREYKESFKEKCDTIVYASKTFSEGVINFCRGIGLIKEKKTCGCKQKSAIEQAAEQVEAAKKEETQLKKENAENYKELNAAIEEKAQQAAAQQPADQASAANQSADQANKGQSKKTAKKEKPESGSGQMTLREAKYKDVKNESDRVLLVQADRYLEKCNILLNGMSSNNKAKLELQKELFDFQVNMEKLKKGNDREWVTTWSGGARLEENILEKARNSIQKNNLNPNDNYSDDLYTKIKDAITQEEFNFAVKKGQNNNNKDNETMLNDIVKITDDTLVDSKGNIIK